jgi:hypothetical protein
VSLLEYVSGVESRFGAAGGLDTPGAAGELGVFQQVPAFREDFGVENPLDTQQAAMGTARALSQYMDQAGGDPTAALVGYNRGASKIDDYLESGRNLSQLPNITAHYVRGWEAFQSALGKDDGPSLGDYSAPVSRTLRENGLPSRRRPGRPQAADQDFSALMQAPEQEGDSSSSFTQALKQEEDPLPSLSALTGDTKPARGTASDGPMSVAQIDAALRRIDNA